MKEKHSHGEVISKSSCGEFITPPISFAQLNKIFYKFLLYEEDPAMEIGSGPYHESIVSKMMHLSVLEIFTSLNRLREESDRFAPSEVMSQVARKMVDDLPVAAQNQIERKSASAKS